MVVIHGGTGIKEGPVIYNMSSIVNNFSNLVCYSLIFESFISILEKKRSRGHSPLSYGCAGLV